MKIAVVGGGIFGITTAYMLAKNHSVDLFEQNHDILTAASDVNQCRLHRGYHYPRSQETVKEVLQSEKSFTDEFSDIVMHNTTNYYCIAKKESLISSDSYIDFCRKNNLEFSITELGLINKENIELCIKVKENLFDHTKLKNLCWQKLNNSKVNVLLGKEATNEILETYDFVVICTYANLNKSLENFPNSQLEYQFELVEKVFVKLPKSFDKKSILIMDGPFGSVDPVGGTDYFILADVVHIIHQKNVGKYPRIDKKFLPLLNKGIIKNPPITNFNLIIDSLARFIPEIKKAKHVGSAFCIKTVLPNVDKTDERPTLVKTINKNTVTIFSGKITTCIETAKKVIDIVEEFTNKILV